MLNKLGVSVLNQGEDWLSEIYAQLLYGKLECNEYSARSTTGAIQIKITCGPHQACNFSTLDASTSHAIFTMDTLIIINLTEDHHTSKSLMPSLSWANVGILTLLLWASVKASLLSHQAYMISDTSHHQDATLNKDICFLDISISLSIKRTSSTNYVNFQILLHVGPNRHFNFKSAFRVDASVNS